MSNLEVTKRFNVFIENPKVQERLDVLISDKKQAFTSNLINLVKNNAMLAQCEPSTLLNAALTATALNLPLSKELGMAYVVPYKNKHLGITEAQFQIGYKGLRQLCHNTKMFTRIVAAPVYENQFISWNPLTEDIDGDFTERGTGEIVGYFAYATTSFGFKKAKFWYKDEAEQHAFKYSKDYKFNMPKSKGIYHDEGDKMHLKNVLKAVLRECPLSVEVLEGIEKDCAVIADDGSLTYPDNPRHNQEPTHNTKEQRVLMYIEQAQTAEQLAQCEATAREMGFDVQYETKLASLLG